MKIRRGWMCLMVCCLAASVYPCQAVGQQNAEAANASAQTSMERDGQHDFDFEIGSWKIHLKKLMHPLTGSTTWVEFDGTSVTRNR
jgi:hypothetical protein